MASFAMTALSGWLAVLLLGANAYSPYLIRATQSTEQGRAAFFRGHCAVGLLIPAAAFVHAWLPMLLGRISRFQPTGLYFATAALCIMLFQIGVGMSLRGTTGKARRQGRRVHFWTMTLIVGLVLIHIFLNRA